VESDAPQPPSRVSEGSGPVDRQAHDDSLILWMLSLSATERMAVAQKFVDDVYALRGSGPIEDLPKR
jgi:hypothetical protein